MNHDRYQVSKLREHARLRITTTSVDNMKQWISDESDISYDDILDNYIVSDPELPEKHQGLMSSQNGRGCRAS